MDQPTQAADSARNTDFLSLLRIGYSCSPCITASSQLASIRTSQRLWAKWLLLTGGVVSVLTSASVCFVRFLVDPSEPPLSAYWWLYFSMFNFVQTMLGLWFVKQRHRRYRQWYYSTLWIVCTNAILWGLLPIWLFPQDNSNFHYFAITILTGSVGLSVIFCFCAIHTSTAYILLTSIPFLVSKSNSPDVIDLNWTGWSFTYNVVLMLAAHAGFYLFVRLTIQAHTIRLINANFEAHSSDWRWEIGKNGQLVYLTEKIKQEYALPGGQDLQHFTLQRFLDSNHHSYTRIIELIYNKRSFSNVIAKGVSAPNTNAERWWNISSTVLLDYQGQYTGATGVCSDISRSMHFQQLEQEKLRLDSIAQMSSTIAHDFNNNLMTIQGFIDLVSTFPDEPNHYAHLTPAVQISVSRSSRMIGQLLSYVKRESIHYESVKLTEVLESCLKESHLAISEHIAIELDHTSEIELITDPMLLQRAIMNLMLNAAETPKQAGRQTRIRISTHLNERSTHQTESHRPQVSIVVEDNGGGIDDEHLSKIFDPFYTSKRQSHGTGLGLSMVKGFAEQSGGHIQAFNTRQGAKFTLTLPIGPRLSPSGLEPCDNSGAKSLHGLKILIVEDNEPYLDVLASTARDDGAEVVIATNLAAADKLLRSKVSFDVLITDLLLPDGFGTDLSLLARELHPDIVIVAITAFDNQLWSQHTQRDNAVMLKKPFHYTKLRNEILRLIAARALLSRSSKTVLPETET